MAERPDYNQLSAIQGLDGATLRIIAVDGSGNILGLLQGDYMGAVKTLAVDSQGRMLAVLTDPEDVFGNPHYLGAAELAVRLGSIANGDRLGNVLMMEDFESGIGKWEASYSAGCAVGHSTLAAYNGAFSCRLYVDNVAGHSAYIRRIVAYYPATTKIGLEMNFSLASALCNPSLGLYVYTGAVLLTAQLKYDPTVKKLYYYDNTGAWIEFGSQWAWWSNIWGWNRLKLVIDLVTGKYVRGNLNGVDYDLSGLSIKSDISAIAGGIVPYIFLTRNVLNGTMYVDDVILTQEEP